MKYYEVKFENQVAGKVKIDKEGLYYRFSCECRLPQSGIYRLMAECTDGKMPLGILVFESGKFVLNTKVAIKRFGTCPIAFSVVADNADEKMKFVPLYPDAPFSHIANLDSARLVFRGGQIGITVQ